MTSLWGTIRGSTILYSLKDSRNFSSHLGFILLPSDNTIAESLFQRSEFKLDTFIYGGFYFPFAKSVAVEIIYFSLWVCFAGCYIIGELLFSCCATILAKCFLEWTMDSEEQSKGNPHPIPSIFSFFMNL
jgi:hypothetical protein